MMSASIVTPRWFAWPGQVGGEVVVGPAVLRAERGVPQVAPEHRREPGLVRLLEGLRDLDDLAPRLLGAEVDRRADGDGPELHGLPHRAEHDLVVRVRVAEELVVVQLDEERDPMRVAARARPEHAERRRNRVAAALDRELDDPRRVEVVGVPRERRAGRVLDALIDREDREVAGPAETAVVEDRLQRAQDRDRAVRLRDDAIDEIGPRQVQPITLDRAADVRQERLGFGAERALDLCERRGRGGRGHARNPSKGKGAGHGRRTPRGVVSLWRVALPLLTVATAVLVPAVAAGEGHVAPARVTGQYRVTYHALAGAKPLGVRIWGVVPTCKHGACAIDVTSRAKDAKSDGTLRFRVRGGDVRAHGARPAGSRDCVDKSGHVIAYKVYTREISQSFHATRRSRLGRALAISGTAVYTYRAAGAAVGAAAASRACSATPTPGPWSRVDSPTRGSHRRRSSCATGCGRSCATS